jgi:sugar lactone lactonase YvrE
MNPMNLRPLCHLLRTATLLCCAIFAANAASPQSAVISLDPTTLHPAATAPVKGEAPYANPPANFYAFASAKVGEPSSVEGLKLRFAAPTTLTSIQSTKDFTIEPGGSCKEGQSFAKGDTCILLVRFTPQGAGPRLGHITINHSASAIPASFGLGGNGYAPVLSFTPSTTATVAGTYVSGHGLLTSSQNLTVDGSDGLYIADTGNEIIRYINSSGAITSLATGLTDPVGIAVDTFGEVYFDETSANKMYEIYDYGPLVQISGSGTDTCTVSTPCDLENEALYSPGQMSIDRYNNLFFANASGGAALSTVQPVPATLVTLDDPFTYQEPYNDAFAVDADDNLYTLWAPSSTQNCEIISQSAYDAENSIGTYTRIVGTRTCGYSGDGGQAGNAEISDTVGQIAFDIAGNLYFTDTNNQRVRRVSAVTGIITTIAGNGTAGYTGDGNQSTNATLSSPTGIAVDSQGQVYVITNAPSTGTAQVVRKLGPNGELAYPSQTTGTSSPARVVNVANTGNTTMTLTSYFFGGTDPGDFSIDPHSTSCVLTAGATLYSGQSCNIGVIFKPAAAGNRSANLIFLDNTVTNTNVVTLSGSGTAPAVIKASPSTVVFPATVPNHTAAQAITVTNSGTANIRIAGITAGGANPTTFAYTSTCSASLAPKGTCTVLVNFNPSSTGSYAATFKIADTAGDTPQTVTVSGTGVAPAPTSIHLASTPSPAGPCSPAVRQTDVTASSNQACLAGKLPNHP